MVLTVKHNYVSSVTESSLSGIPGGLVGPTEWNDDHVVTGSDGMPVAVSDMTFYLSTTGNDSNPGTITQPFATCQRAYNEAQRYNWQSSFTPTIQFLDGTYAADFCDIVDLTNNTGGVAFQGNLASPGNCVVNMQFSMTAPQTPVGFGGFEFRGTDGVGSCINPVLGNAGIIGPIIFSNTLNESPFFPFFLEGDTSLQILGVNLTVSATTIFAFVHLVPGAMVIGSGSVISLPVALTVTDAFIRATGIIDNTDPGVTFYSQGSGSFTNAGGVTGPKVIASQGAWLKTPTGELSEIPGSTLGTVDGSVYVKAFNPTGKLGQTYRSDVAGFPMASNLPQGTWNVLKDTTGVNRYLAANDSGTLSLLSARRPLAGANLTWYVATTGSNSNPGTVGSPFATIQYAADFAGIFDYQGLYFPTINVADGTYTLSGTNPPGIVLPEVLNTLNAAGGFLTGNTGTPANCVLNDTVGISTIGMNGLDGIWTINGFQLNSPGGTVFTPTNGGSLSTFAIILDNSSSGPFYQPFNAAYLCQVFINGPLTFTDANIGTFGFIQQESFISIGGATINLQPAMAATFEWFDVLTYSHMGFGGNTISNLGTATGNTAILNSYSSILTDNGQEADLIGTVGTLVGDASSEFAKHANLVGGFFANKVASLPSTSHIIAGGWNLFKDTSGGTVNLAYNDAGTIKMVELGGLSTAVVTAALTTLGAQGSMTFRNGVLVSQIQAT